MKKDDLYNAISEINDEYLEEADSYYPKTNISWKKWIAVAASVCLLCGTAVPVLAASDHETAYEIMYAISPAIAQKLKPVRLSAEDNGIKMEVVAANIEDTNARILVEFQDLEKNRIDDTTDLFDSYSIHTPYDHSGGCTFVKYDYETGKATFMIEIEQKKPFLKEKDKITFSVKELLNGVENKKIKIDQIDLENIPEVQKFISNADIRGTGGKGVHLKNHKIMALNDEDEIMLENGVVLKGYGMVDDQLHIQVKYENILETDNHGYCYLKDSAGKTVDHMYSVSFWDDNEKDSIYEYVFDVPGDQLMNYDVHGEFWIGTSELIKGNWQVTFPLE